MSTYNSIIKKRNPDNTDWDTILPVTTAENVMVNETNSVKDMLGSLSSYMAFCGNVNTTMLDAAFGKNNEDLVLNLGKQLAMYAWYKGDSKVTYPFTTLKTLNTLTEILNNNLAKDEILGNLNLRDLITASTYAKPIIFDIIYISMSGSSDGAVSSGEITITQEDIDFGKVYFTGTHQRTTFAFQNTVRINNIVVPELSGGSNGGPPIVKAMFLYLSTYGMTVPGIYPISTSFTYADRGNPTSFNVTIHKVK